MSEQINDVEGLEHRGMHQEKMKQEEQYLKEWAWQYGAVYNPEGECGFGRECVGIIMHDHWIDLGPTGKNPKYPESDFEYVQVTDGADAPEGVEDAYHKHPCLAILGRGDNAVHQLYLWVKNIEASGLVIKEESRTPVDMIDLIMHGVYTVYLGKP